MDQRTEIAAMIVAQLAQRDAKPCRRKSDVLEAIAYADELIRRLEETPKNEKATHTRPRLAQA